MQLYRGIRVGPTRPQARYDAQVDESRVPRIDRRCESEPVGSVTIHLARPEKQLLRKCGEELPEPLLVDPRLGVAGYPRAEA
jgi:hypothetical protein